MKKKRKSIVGTIALSMVLLATVFSTNKGNKNDKELEGGDRESIIVWSLGECQN